MYLKYCIIIAPWVSIWFQPPSMQGPLCKAAGVCIWHTHSLLGHLKHLCIIPNTEHKGNVVHIVIVLFQNNDMNTVCSCSAQIH